MQFEKDVGRITIVMEVIQPLLLEVFIAIHHSFDLWLVCSLHSSLVRSSLSTPPPPFSPSRDRMMLLKLEQDILEFINDDK